MKLICEVNEEIQYITEDVAGSKQYYIEGIFIQGELANKNKRIYPMHILDREVARYTKERINENMGYGELNHPTGPNINLDRVSHMIKSLTKSGNNYIGRAKIMETPCGQIVKNFMNEGAKLGVSTRGMGSLREKGGYQEVQDDYYLATAADIVADPSAPDAFVRGIMEDRDWVYNNGLFQEIDLINAKKKIDESIKRREYEETSIKVFERFMSKL